MCGGGDLPFATRLQAWSGEEFFQEAHGRTNAYEKGSGAVPVSHEGPTIQASSRLRTNARWARSPAASGVSAMFPTEHVESPADAGRG